MNMLLLAVALVLGGGVLWYLLIATEGVYLGRRVVIGLYDLYARRYDNIKQFDTEWEALTLGTPLAEALRHLPQPLILDVATGTARLPRLLRQAPAFDGVVLGLDYSWRMLRVAAEKLGETPRVALLYQDATHLPFADETFDAVTCLEALEFLPDPTATLSEIVRVARAGAPILLTNRKGIHARLMPTKTQPSEAFAAWLREKIGLVEVVVEIWQMEYDLIWAVKAGTPPMRQVRAWQAALRCPACQKIGFRADAISALVCLHCERRLPITAEGIVRYAK
ncbi:MAG: class I SAM-dependent methyltransferase [Chloroflexi bacterium CFX4]|nr:class I SAM-dependent methyltransferase [Chloroflexi bacterium CFX4]MDL1923878.1 class I SAM-dependent methyltransferase [Chloroflexi bacterium CFX3]